MEQQTFRTTISIKPAQVKFDVVDSLFSIGSCFAEELNTLMSNGFLQAYQSPYGTVYNPQSIEFQIHRIVTQTPATEAEIVERDGFFVSLMAHGSVMAETKESLLAKLDQYTQEANRQLREVHFVLITLGTAYVYNNISMNMVVANCQKQNAKLFNRYRISQAEATASLRKVIGDIKSINPSAQIIFTVSPIRHLADGMVENTLSKSTLLLSVADVVDGVSVQYFPSYEIVMDDLRDYRFYASDMAHPSPEAVRYVYEHFAHTYFSDKTRDLAREGEKISTMLRHRPLTPNASKYAEFLDKARARIKVLAKQYSLSDSYKPIANAFCLLDNLRS